MDGLLGTGGRDAGAGGAPDGVLGVVASAVGPPARPGTGAGPPIAARETGGPCGRPTGAILGLRRGPGAVEGVELSE